MASISTAPVGTAGNASYVNPFAPTAPTAAPTGQTSVTQPPASAVAPVAGATPPASSTPTAVVSSNTATNQINNKIVPTMTAGQQDVQTGITNATIQAQKVQDGITAMKAAPVDTTKTTPTPEETIANTPDPGNQWLYDASGNKVQNTLGSPIPPGYSTTNPTAAPTMPVVDTTTDSSGNTYQQYSDGTYGKLDATGKYIGPTDQKNFQTNKDGQSLLTSLNQVVNGTYPLTPAQQAQVTGLQASFAALIQQQQIANANFTGGVTVAENLYGMGNSISGIGEIKGSVDAGIAKIADLNSQLVSATAKMESGFQTDNFNMLKGAYDLYNQASKDKQAELDHLNDVAKQAQDDFKAQQQQQIQNTLESDKFTYQQKQDAFDNYIKTAQLSDSEKNDAFDHWYKQQDIAIKQATLDASTVSPSTAIDQVPGVRSMNSTGLQYFDPSSINDPKLAKNAEAAARANGVPVVDPKDAPVVEKIDSALQTLQTMGEQAKNLSSSNIPGASLMDRAENFAGDIANKTGVYTTDYQSAMNTYNDSRTQLISIISGLAGQSSRLNGSLLTAAEEALPKFGVINQDTIKQANSDIMNSRKYLYGALQSVVPNAQLPASGDISYPDLNGYVQAHPDQKEAVATFAESHPDLSSDDIKQIFNN